MAINSLKFIVFVAVVCCIYFIAPKKIKWVVLLLANYIFYWLCSNWLIVYMLITTLSIYLIGLRIGVIDKHTKEKCKGLQDREQKSMPSAMILSRPFVLPSKDSAFRNRPANSSGLRVFAT